jgi:hypothetical protein
MSAAKARVHRAHRFLVPTLLVLATLIGFVGAFAVWVNRQALNTDNWRTTSSKLLADKQVQDSLGTYMVNELFTNVDVAAALRQQLPQPVQALAAPAAAGLQQLATQVAPKLLARPAVQDAWVAANTAAHKELITIIDGGGSVVSTTGGVVTLNLHTLVDQLATNLGVQDQVNAARAKIQSSGAGAKARSLAQQKGITLPPKSGQIVIMRSNQLKTAQDIAGAVRHLAIVLPIVAVALFALAVWLARQRRRRTLRASGWCFVVIGMLLLLIRRVAGNQIVNSLVQVPSNKGAVHQVWNIGTSLLYAIAVALIAYGLAAVVAAWIGGPTRPATAMRRALAPSLRDSAGLAYATAGGAFLLIVIWGPTPAFRMVGWVLVFAALLALGVTLLRRQAALEFPDAQHGDTSRRMRESWEARRSRRDSPVPTAPAASGESAMLDELERLVSLHAHGDLSDSEFAAAKTRVTNGS